MPNNLMTDFKDLEPLAKRINASSDELTQTLQTIQDRLNALGIGVTVWLTDCTGVYFGGHVLHESDWTATRNGRARSISELGYGRLGEGWALLVRTRRFVESDFGPDGEANECETYDDDLRPLLKASRELRMAAVPLIPHLLDTIKGEAQTVADRVEQAKKIADSLK